MMNGMSLHLYPKGGLTQGVKFPYTAFPIIILHRYCEQLHYASAHAMQFRDMGNCTHIWELQCTLALYIAFKTESNAIEFVQGELDNLDAGLKSVAQLEQSLSKC